MKSILFGYFLSKSVLLVQWQRDGSHELSAIAGFRILGNLVIAIQLKLMFRSRQFQNKLILISQARLDLTLLCKGYVYCLVAFPNQICIDCSMTADWFTQPMQGSEYRSTSTCLI